MFQTIQCVNKPRGASGSSTIKTSDFASFGTPLICNSGLTFLPLQVNLAGISLPAGKAGLVIEIDEAAFILKIPTKIARANHIGFIHSILVARAQGQARGGRIGISADEVMLVNEDRSRLKIINDEAISSGERTRLACWRWRPRHREL